MKNRDFLFERAKGIIYRDRFSSFIELIREGSAKCVPYSMINAYIHLKRRRPDSSELISLGYLYNSVQDFTLRNSLHYIVSSARVLGIHVVEIVQQYSLDLVYDKNDLDADVRYYLRQSNKVELDKTPDCDSYLYLLLHPEKGVGHCVYSEQVVPYIPTNTGGIYELKNFLDEGYMISHVVGLKNIE